MSGHQSGGVVLTEAEREVWDVCPRCGVETYSHNDLGRTIRPQTCDLRVPEARIAAIESILTARLAAQAGRVAEVVEKVLSEVADEMPAGTKSDYSIWEGETVCYEGYEKSPNDGRPATWLRGQAAMFAARVAAELEADQ